MNIDNKPYTVHRAWAMFIAHTVSIPLWRFALAAHSVLDGTTLLAGIASLLIRGANAEVVSVMALMASSKCFESFFRYGEALYFQWVAISWSSYARIYTDVRCSGCIIFHWYARNSSDNLQDERRTRSNMYCTYAAANQVTVDHRSSSRSSTQITRDFSLWVCFRTRLMPLNSTSHHSTPPHTTQLHLTLLNSTSPLNCTSYYSTPPHNTQLHLTSLNSTSHHSTSPYTTQLHLTPLNSTSQHSTSTHTTQCHLTQCNTVEPLYREVSLIQR